MTQVTIDTTNVFHKAYKSSTRITCLQGGTRSSKTYSLCQLFIVKALRETGKVFTICRKTLPALKGSVYRDFIEIAQQTGIYYFAEINKAELTFQYKNHLVEFISLDNEMKVRGRKRNICFLNEANEFFLEDFNQLALRTTGKIILDFKISKSFKILRKISFYNNN